MKTPFESFRSFMSEAFRDGFIPSLTKTQRGANAAWAEERRKAKESGGNLKPIDKKHENRAGVSLMANTGEFTDEFGVPNWDALTNPGNRERHGNGGINPLLANLKYNRGDDSSIAQFDKPFTLRQLRDPQTIHNRLDKVIAFTNKNCGSPLTDEEVVRFVDDLRNEMIAIMVGRQAPRKIQNTSANRNRIHAEETNAKVAEFRRRLENARTPDEILRVFAPVLEFRARLEKVRKELLRRRTNISKAAFQLTEYTMSNTLRMYACDKDAIFVEAIGTWKASENGIGFGRDVDMARAKRISLVQPNTAREPDEIRKLRGDMFLMGRGASSKFDLNRTEWGGFQKAVDRGRFLGDFKLGDYWVDVRFTRRYDGKRDELDDIVDEFSPVGPDYHGKVKLLPEYENRPDKSPMEEIPVENMQEEAFPTEGSAEAVDVLLNVMQKFGMNITNVRGRIERGMRSKNIYSIDRNTSEAKTTERFMEYLVKLAKFELNREYGKRRSNRREADIIDFQASAVAQMVCMQVGFNMAALSANDSVRRLFSEGLFGDPKTEDPDKVAEAAESLVVSSDVASEITAALLDTLARRRRAKHENYD